MPTSTRVDLLFTYRIEDGQETRFQDYLGIVPPLTEASEPYVLEYELFRREDGTFLQHERYVDEDAMSKHLEVTAEGQKAWGEATELLTLDVIGEVSQNYRDSVVDLPGVTYYQRFQAITR